MTTSSSASRPRWSCEAAACPVAERQSPRPGTAASPALPSGATVPRGVRTRDQGRSSAEPANSSGRPGTEPCLGLAGGPHLSLGSIGSRLTAPKGAAHGPPLQLSLGTPSKSLGRCKVIPTLEKTLLRSPAATLSPALPMPLRAPPRAHPPSPQVSAPQPPSPPTRSD